MSRRAVVLLAAMFLLALTATVIVRFPLSLALTLLGIDAAGLTALRASGSVWDGRLERAAIGRRVIGDVTMGLEPGDLLAGRARLDWRLDHPGLEGGGVLILQPGGAYALEDVRLSGRMLHLPTLVPLEGSLRLDAKRIAFGPEGCRAGQAQLWSDALARSRASLRWEGPVLEGTAACRGSALAVQMAGDSPGGAVSIEAHLQPSLRYAVDVTVTSEDRQLRRSLRVLGFEAEADGELRLVQEGMLKPAKETS